MRLAETLQMVRLAELAEILFIPAAEAVIEIIMPGPEVPEEKAEAELEPVLERLEDLAAADTDLVEVKVLGQIRMNVLMELTDPMEPADTMQLPWELCIRQTLLRLMQPEETAEAAEAAEVPVIP